MSLRSFRPVLVVGSRPRKMFSATVRWGHQDDLLMDYRNSGAASSLNVLKRTDNFAVDGYDAAVRLDDSAKDIDQCRLSRAVLSE